MEPPAPPDQSPYQPARPAETQERRWFGLSPAWVVVIAVVTVLLLVYGAGKVFQLSSANAPAPATVPRNESPGIDGIVARDAPVAQARVGDCLTDFGGPLGTATIVTCRTPHTAQYIGTATLPDTPYPGDERTTEKAEEACKAIELDPAAALVGSWVYQFSRPSKGTWAEGDRTVECFLVLSEGTSTGSLLPGSDA